ncbi:hypothetical protein DXG01_011310 [Tephrocybe rancida]|nr:hypothetical protein DXG01_011310 [Tephrocybe rancida]
MNTTVPEATFLLTFRILLFLGCRKYLLKSLYSDLRTLSSDPASDLTPPATPNTAQDGGIELDTLPTPATQSKSGKTGSYSDARSMHSTVARTVFSLMFAESSMMFFVLMLQGLNIFSPWARRLSWQFSLIFLMTVILVAVPLAVSLLIAIGPKSASAGRSSFLLGPRILLCLIPVGMYLFALSRIPLPPSLIASETFTASLARLIVVGTIILGLLSGFGAISHCWAYIPRFSPKSDPTERDVATAEYSLQSVRNDLRERRSVADQRANSAEGSTSWLSRVTPNFRGGDGLTQELRGLEALEYHMSLNVESLRARRQAAIYAGTLRGRIVNFGGLLFAFYCIVRIFSCLINVLDPSRRESSQSQTDLIAELLVRVLALVSHPDSAAITSLARQLSLALVGLIIMTSVRRVLKGATRALRVTSRNLGASLMMLLLAQLMGIYLLSTVVQLRNSFPPPPDADINLFSTIPQFEVFGAVFDWSVLVAAAASGFLRWGNEKVNGLKD